MIEVTLETVSTSNADDLGYRALADVSTLTRDLDTRVVGGQMVGLLLTAFPTPEAIIRRTADADAALTAKVAASGHVHELLTQAGYTETAGNSYVKEGQQIDLLVPAPASSFTRESLGGRGFDAAPGLRLVLAGEAILAHVNVTLTHGSVVSFDARVPCVEHAVILKASAYANRRAAKDLTDLHNLLQIAHARDSAEIGGWQLDRAGLVGARGDAQRTLHEIATSARASAIFAEARVRPELLAALIRARVGVPD